MNAWRKKRRTSWGIAFVALFAPSLSAAEVVLSVMPGVEDACDGPVIWLRRGPVDLGMKIDV